jgi:hypothetical protein
VECSKKQFLIMTSKEKAIEIVIKMQFQKEPLMFEQAKQCALITADEAAKITSSRYWYDVQREIQKL